MNDIIEYLHDEIKKAEKYYVASLCAHAITYSNTIKLKEYILNSKQKNLPLTDFFPLKKERRVCGTVVLAYDKEKSIKLQTMFSTKHRDARSVGIIKQKLSPTNYNENNDIYNLFIKTLKEKHKASEHFERCPISLGKCRCAKVTSNTSAKEILSVIKQSLITDNEINEYISQNPEKNKIKKFGEPQSKYRNGTYGLHGMEINQWNK